MTENNKNNIKLNPKEKCLEHDTSHYRNSSELDKKDPNFIEENILKLNCIKNEIESEEVFQSIEKIIKKEPDFEQSKTILYVSQKIKVIPELNDLIVDIKEETQDITIVSEPVEEESYYNKPDLNEINEIFVKTEYEIQSSKTLETSEHKLTVSRTNDGKFSCQYCSKKFRLKHHLKGHMASHIEERNFACLLCSKKFKVKEVLTRHMKTHTKETNFDCTLCSIKFKRKGNLDRHMIFHNKERKFVCPLCSKTFNLKAVLKRHMIFHNDERKFSCSLCSKKFKLKDDLNRHMKTHTEERNFACPLCSKKFKVKTDLTFHMKTHTEERNFDCPLCPKKFKMKQYLTQHMKIHNG